MLKTTPGSTDGKTVTVFNEGVIYDSPEEIPQHLVNIFTKIGACVEYSEPVAVKEPVAVEPEIKKEPKAPINKAINSAPSNKKVGKPFKRKK